MDYNVPGGKLNRGMSVVDSVEILKGRPLTDDEYFKAAVLGWCVELVRSPLSPFFPLTRRLTGHTRRRSSKRSSSSQTT